MCITRNVIEMEVFNSLPMWTRRSLMIVAELARNEYESQSLMPTVTRRMTDTRPGRKCAVLPKRAQRRELLYDRALNCNTVCSSYSPFTLNQLPTVPSSLISNFFSTLSQAAHLIMAYTLS